MLWTIENGITERIDPNYIPRKGFFNGIRSKISNSDFDQIIETIQDHFTDITQLENDKQIECSAFIPGEDWTGTPYQVIYDACGDITVSAMFFGICVWIAVQLHEADWGFSDNTPHNILGKTYFRISPSP